MKLHLAYPIAPTLQMTASLWHKGASFTYTSLIQTLVYCRYAFQCQKSVDHMAINFVQIKHTVLAEKRNDPETQNKTSR